MSWIIAQGTASFLDRPTGQLIGLVFMVGLIAFILICTIGYIWQQFRKSDIDASLKHEMIQRGMSADEIERVLAATTTRGGANSTASKDRPTLPYPAESAK